MNDENKIIIYQVFTRLLEITTTTVSTMETLPPMVAGKWLISRSKHLVKSRN